MRSFGFGFTVIVCQKLFRNIRAKTETNLCCVVSVPPSYVVLSRCRKVTLVCLEVPNKDRSFLERRDVETCVNSLGKIMTMTVMHSVTVQDNHEVLYTPGTRKKRPGGTRKEESGNQYSDMPKK